MYIYVLLYYVCIQKPKPVPEAAIHLANTVLRQNSQCCCCFGSWRDSQLEFKAQALTRAVNGPRAKLLLPFAVLRQLTWGGQPNWNPFRNPYWRSKDRAFRGIPLISLPRIPSLLVPMEMLQSSSVFQGSPIFLQSCILLVDKQLQGV